jgi:hypothetical protein
VKITLCQPEIAMKAILVLLSVFLWQNISARQSQPSDSISLRYAVTDTAARTENNLHYSLVRFSVNPGQAVQHYSVVKVISPLHYILKQTNFDTALQKKVVYIYTANCNWKATTQLLQQLDETAATDSIRFMAAVNNINTAVRYCRYSMRSGAVIHVIMHKKDWDLFITQPVILFSDRFRKAKGEILINTSDPSANAINTAQQKYPFIKGSRITVSLKEDLLDTTDIDFSGRYLPSSVAAKEISSHATIMATTIGGAGNNGLKSLGAAPQVKFVSADFNASLSPEDAGYFRQYDVTIQNHSYGTGIENYYGLEAAAYDEQVYTTDTILHVFSSGNTGTTAAISGIYQGLPGYANLSGTFKQAKNVLVVGGTDDLLQVISLSSGGPAYDGRVKPELVAFGIEGTSGAAAVSSGAAALVSDAYKQTYSLAPSAALVKALLINSAVKTDNIPLSHKGGYGSLHALAALNTLQAKQFMRGTGTQHFTVTVPPGMQHLQVTLCWNDPAAVVNAPKALVNDLDLIVSDASGHTWLPWVLSSAPVADSLLLAAHRGRDSLNNVEQVTIDNPPPGELNIQVNSPAAAQSFYLVYSWTPQRHFEWLNPGSREILYAGGNLPLPLRWNSNLTGKGDLFYSLDCGISWLPLSQQLSASNGLFYWSVPDTFSTALLKFTMPDTTFISDTFYLSPRVSLQTGYDCGDSAFIYWSSLASAGAYEVYRLGAQYLTPYTSATDTFLLITDGGSPTFAVSPVHKDGWTGLKSFGTNYTTQGTGCYFKTLLATITAEHTVSLSLSIGTSWQLQQLYWERLSGNGYVTLSNQAISGTDYTYVDATAPAGVVYYRVKLVTATGKVIYADPVPVYLLNNNAYLLYPNPVHTTLYLLSKEPGDTQLQIYDMAGRLVLQKALYEQSESLWVQDLPAGVYNCVLFNHGKKVMAKKIIKE